MTKLFKNQKALGTARSVNVNADALSRNPPREDQQAVREEDKRTKQTVTALPIITPKPTRTSTIRQNHTRTSSAPNAILSARRGRKKGSTIEVTLPKSGKTGGQADINASSIGKRLLTRRLAEPKKKVTIIEPSESETTEQVTDSENSDALDQSEAPPIELKERSAFPHLITPSKYTTTSTDTSSDSEEENIKQDETKTFLEDKETQRNSEEIKTHTTSNDEDTSNTICDENLSSSSLEDDVLVPDFQSTMRKSIAPLHFRDDKESEGESPAKLDRKEFAQDLQKSFYWWDSFLESQDQDYRENKNIEVDDLSSDFSWEGGGKVKIHPVSRDVTSAPNSPQKTEEQAIKNFETQKNKTIYNEITKPIFSSTTRKSCKLPPSKLSAYSTIHQEDSEEESGEENSEMTPPHEHTKLYIEENNTGNQIAGKTELYKRRGPYSTYNSPILDNKIKISITNKSLTYLKDNLVLFLSKDAKLRSENARLLADLDALKENDLISAKPDIGDVIVTEHRKRYIFSVIVATTYKSPVLPEDISNGLTTLSEILREKDIKSIRISRKGELTDHLPKGILPQIIVNTLSHLNLAITVCFGSCSTPPSNVIGTILEEHHASLFGGHRGITKTYHRIRERYFWKGMREEIEKFVRTCPICQEWKSRRIKPKEQMIITDTPAEVFSKIAIDTVGPLPKTPSGNLHILTAQCLLSKFCIGIPIPNIKALTIADALARNLFAIYGVPKVILSDRGKSFRNKLLDNLSQLYGIKLINTTAYHPQSNGSLERSHAMLGNFLRTQAEKQDWDKIVPFAISEYNTSVHAATGFTPYEIVYGKKARTPSRSQNYTDLETYDSYVNDLNNCLAEVRKTARENLIHAKENSKRYYDKTSKPQRLAIGMDVYVLKEPRKGKLDKYYKGTFKIVDLSPTNNAIIMSEDGHKTTKHIDKLKPVIT